MNPTGVDFWSKGFAHQSHGLGWLVDGLRLLVHALGIVGRCPSTYWGKGFAFSAEPVAFLAAGIALRAKGVTSASQARHLSRLTGFPRRPEPCGFFPVGAGQGAGSLAFRMKPAPR